MKRIALALALLAGCSAPYATPEAQPSRALRGVVDYFGDRFQPGGPRRVRMIFTHGMCSDSHREGWVAERAAQVARAVGGTASVPLARNPYRPAGADPVTGAVQRHDVDIVSPQGTVAATFLTWGRQVDRYRENLAYENTRRGPTAPDAPERASLNAGLKTELMNRCLIDAVVYLGPNGDPIRRNMRAALCDVLGGRFDETGSGNPRVADRCQGLEADPVPTVLVPESLGSTILFEALTGLDDGEGQRRLARSLGSVRSIFLASNQFPLLDQASEPDVGPGVSARALARSDDRALGGALGDVLILLGTPPAAALRSARIAAPAEPVQLVAITDPNDVLGYRLDPEVFSPDRYPWVEMTNVLVSNAPTWFGSVADPLAAHRKTARDPVFDLIARGRAAP